MKLKLLILTLIVSLSMILMCSCDIFPGMGTGGGGGDINPPDGQGGGKTSYSQLVCESLDFDLSDFRYEYQELVGALIPTVTDVEPARSGEIVFGDTNRAITAEAREKLESLLSGTKYDSGYIIYANGGSVAVYWTVPDMATIAMSEFINICIIENKLVIEDGVILKKLYDKRQFHIDKYWLALETKTTSDVIAALREIYNYYNGSNITEWLANLYDSETGGIYYSRSARDNYPFLPDLESTAQGISWLINNDAISNRNQLPNDIKIKFIEFAKAMQSPKDGYFYHPQWPEGKENLAVDRYSRDLGWATSLITDFLADYDGDGINDPQYPNWCAPNGTKCALHHNTADTCSFANSSSYYTDGFSSVVTSALSTTQTAAIGKLPTASTIDAVASSSPDFTSKYAFSAWLEEYNATIKEDSGRAHQLAALKGQIKAKGYTDVVLDHLDRIQKEVFEEQLRAGETPTGLWQKNVDYKAVWGLLKYMSFYNDGSKRKIDIQYVPYIVQTCIQVIESPADGDYASNDLYNQWSGLSGLISNVKHFYGESGVRQIYSMMQENTASLIAKSLEKIEPFKQEDGSFSSRSTGITGGSIYGTSIALGTAEGNVNSTGLICSMYRCIYSCLGLPVVPLCNEDDGQMFIDTIQTLPPIEKNEIPSGKLDFESGELETMLKATLKNESEGSHVKIVADPDDDTNNVLYFASEAEAGSNAGDSIAFTTGGTGTTCYLLESSFYVSSDSKDANILQIKLGDSYMIMLTKSGEKVKITDNAATNTALAYTILGYATTDTWFKIRAEYYVDCEENGIETPKMKIYIDDEYVCTSENYFGSNKDNPSPKNTYKEVNMLSPKKSYSYVYIDNCTFEKTTDIYTPEVES